MLEISDYSGRRGVIVPLLPKIHALLKETAEKDTLAAFAPPEHYILWKQNAYKKLVEVHRRWLVVLDGPALAGFLFYHFETSIDVYIDELRIAWAYRNNGAVFTLLLDKFANNHEVRKVTSVFASLAVKKETSQEILASVGFGETFEGGWEPLGSLSDAVGALKLRYGK